MFATLIAKLCQVAFLAWFAGSMCSAPTPQPIPTIEPQHIDSLVRSGPTQLGAVNPVAGCRYTLDGSGVGSSDTSVSLVSFTECRSGNELVMADFGEIGYATIEPGSQTKKEFISFTGVTQNGSNTKATLTGVTRGLNFISPYTASSSLRESHSGGSTLIISNPPQLYDTFVSKHNDGRVSSTLIFSNLEIPRLDAAHIYGSGEEEYFATKRYVDSVATSGAPDANLTTKGIAEIATIAETISGASTGDTTARLVPENTRFNTTSTATTTVPVTNTSGKLSQGFQDLTVPWSFSNLNSASTTITGTTTLTSTATTTFNGGAIFNGTVTGSASFPGILIAASTTNVTVGATTAETAVVSSTIPANTLGTTGIVRATAYFSSFDTNAATDSFNLVWQYGSTRVATTTLLCGGNAAGLGCLGKLDLELFSAGTTNSQEAIATSMFTGATTTLRFVAGAVLPQAFASSTAGTAFSFGTSAVDSTSAQSLKLLVTNSTNSVNQTVTMTRYTIWRERQ